MRPQRPAERKRRATDSDIHVDKANLRVGMSYPLPNEPFPTLQIEEHASVSRIPKMTGPILINPLMIQQPNNSRRRRQSQVPTRQPLTEGSKPRRVSYDKPISDREIRQAREELRQMAEESRQRKIARGNVPDWANDHQPLSTSAKLRKELVPLRSLKDIKIIENRDLTHQLV